MRVEAAYHLARLAHSNNDAATVKTHIEQIMQIDPASPWAQRVMSLQLEEVSMATEGAASTSVEEESSEESEPVIRLNLSGSE